MQELTLPWPPKDLNPNQRVHWSKKAKAAKDYRERCAWIARAHEWNRWPHEGKLHLWIDFYPPDKRARDDDNMIAAFKSGRDGLADALGIDDKRFVCHPWNKEIVGGMVKVRVTQSPPKEQA